MLTRLDWKKDQKALYAPTDKQVTELVVPPMQYLMVDGSGNPNTAPWFQQATEALYSLSYTLKFGLKKQGVPVEYAVYPLEGLWWMDDMSALNPSTLLLDKERFIWTLLIAQPAHVTPAHVEQARAEAARKKPALAQALAALRLETYDEGACVQIMHVGPYDAEPPTIQKLHDHVAGKGWHLRGKHHEIYLSDPRRTAPEKMKTVIRQPYGR